MMKKKVKADEEKNPIAKFFTLLSLKTIYSSPQYPLDTQTQGSLFESPEDRKVNQGKIGQAL